MRTLFICIVFLAIANFLIYQEIFASDIIEVSILEVGNGKPFLIRTPHYKTILVDAGSDASILRALGVTLPPWKRTIEAVILTSEKSNFVGGLPEIKNKYRVLTFMYVGKDIPYGTGIIFGDKLHITILSPGKLSIFYEQTSIEISSSTPPGTFVSDGSVMKRTK